MDDDEFDAHFDALNEHLQGVRPVFDEFCARHGFVYVERRAIGRYPRIRIERAGNPTIWFDLWMELDADGRRYEQFNRKLPYELSAGAHVDVVEPTGQGRRYFKTFVCFANVPFEDVQERLMRELEEHLPTLLAWNEDYLQQNGKLVVLRPHGSSTAQRS